MFNKKRKSDNKGYVAITKTMKSGKIEAEPIGPNSDVLVDVSKTNSLFDIFKTCSQKK